MENPRAGLRPWISGFLALGFSLLGSGSAIATDSCQDAKQRFRADTFRFQSAASVVHAISRFQLRGDAGVVTTDVVSDVTVNSRGWPVIDPAVDGQRTPKELFSTLSKQPVFDGWKVRFDARRSVAEYSLECPESGRQLVWRYDGRGPGCEVRDGAGAPYCP